MFSDLRSLNMAAPPCAAGTSDLIRGSLGETLSISTTPGPCLRRSASGSACKSRPCHPSMAWSFAKTPPHPCTGVCRHGRSLSASVKTPAHPSPPHSGSRWPVCGQGWHDKLSIWRRKPVPSAASGCEPGQVRKEAAAAARSGARGVAGFPPPPYFLAASSGYPHND